MTNQDQITQALAAAGFSSAQIAGIEGNLQIESNFNPGAINPREGAHGIAQWEGGRWANLQKYAASLGKPWDDVNTQVGFLVSELQGPEAAAMPALAQATTPTQAATAFDQLYERSSAASLPARIAAANAIASGGAQGGTASGVPSGGTSSGLAVQDAGLFGSIWDGFLTAMAPVGRLIVDAGLVILGAAAIIAGVVIMAKASSDRQSGGPVVIEEGKGGAVKAAEGDAAEGAEVAAA